MIDTFRNEYFFLSNFYLADINYNGLCYMNAEAAFQAAKETSDSEREKYCSMDGKTARKTGRSAQLRPDWNNVRLGIMEDIVRCKFDQNPDIRQKLIDTGNEEIQENNTWGDAYWGVCNGIGENHLGNILMDLRKYYNKIGGNIMENKENEKVTPNTSVISIGSFSDIKTGYDEIWLIVRSLKNMPQAPEGAKIYHVPELSPSLSLFHKYLSLKNNGTWNKDTFESVYLPQFLQEMHNKESIKMLNILYGRYKAGVNVLLVCYCTEESLCHRSIVAGLLQGTGVDTGDTPDYSRYYQMFKETKDKAVKTACFTGKRPKDLHGYDDRKLYYNIIWRTQEVVKELYSQGYRRFISGGAQGFDQLAFWAVHNVKKSCPDIENVVYAPYKNQEKPWPNENGVFGKAEYRQMLNTADEVIYCTPEEEVNSKFSKALHYRNHCMVDSSSLVIALYPDDTWDDPRTFGGTAECMKYAKHMERDIKQICYNPGTAYNSFKDIPVKDCHPADKAEKQA